MRSLGGSDCCSGTQKRSRGTQMVSAALKRASNTAAESGAGCIPFMPWATASGTENGNKILPGSGLVAEFMALQALFPDKQAQEAISLEHRNREDDAGETTPHELLDSLLAAGSTQPGCSSIVTQARMNAFLDQCAPTPMALLAIANTILAYEHQREWCPACEKRAESTSGNDTNTANGTPPHLHPAVTGETIAHLARLGTSYGKGTVFASMHIPSGTITVVAKPFPPETCMDLYRLLMVAIAKDVVDVHVPANLNSKASRRRLTPALTQALTPSMTQQQAPLPPLFILERRDMRKELAHVTLQHMPPLWDGDITGKWVTPASPSPHSKDVTEAARALLSAAIRDGGLFPRSDVRLSELKRWFPTVADIVRVVAPIWPDGIAISHCRRFVTEMLLSDDDAVLFDAICRAVWGLPPASTSAAVLADVHVQSTSGGVTVTCPICLSDKPLAAFMLLSCWKHMYCLDCSRHLFKCAPMVLDNDLVYLNSKCRVQCPFKCHGKWSALPVVVQEYCRGLAQLMWGKEATTARAATIPLGGASSGCTVAVGKGDFVRVRRFTAGTSLKCTWARVTDVFPTVVMVTWSPVDQRGAQCLLLRRNDVLLQVMTHTDAVKIAAAAEAAAACVDGGAENEEDAHVDVVTVSPVGNAGGSAVVNSSETARVPVVGLLSPQPRVVFTSARDLYEMERAAAEGVEEDDNDVNVEAGSADDTGVATEADDANEANDIWADSSQEDAFDGSVNEPPTSLMQLRAPAESMTAVTAVDGVATIAKKLSSRKVWPLPEAVTLAEWSTLAQTCTARVLVFSHAQFGPRCLRLHRSSRPGKQPASYLGFGQSGRLMPPLPPVLTSLVEFQPTPLPECLLVLTRAGFTLDRVNEGCHSCGNELHGNLSAPGALASLCAPVRRCLPSGQPICARCFTGASGACTLCVAAATYDSYRYYNESSSFARIHV